jgi:hypothetical protein
LDERSVEFEGRLRVVVARAGGGALTIREALAGEEISRVGPARNVHYSILVLREQVKPPRLMVAEVPLLVQPHKARVICMQLEGLVKQVRSQRLECVDHSKQFEEMRRVQPFRRCQLARLEGDWVVRAGIVGLLQDGGDGQLRCVGEQARRPRRVPHTENRGRCQRRLEGCEALLLRGTPAEGSAGTA